MDVATFKKLADYLKRHSKVKDDLEQALRDLVHAYDVSDQGARFVVGGAAEWMLAMAFIKSGVTTIPAGHGSKGYDLLSAGKQSLGASVKFGFTLNTFSFRISNGMGGAGRGLSCPTIFAHPRLEGLVFVDPNLHSDVVAKTRNQKDAITLDGKHLISHKERLPECFCNLKIPENPRTGANDVGYPLAKEILSKPSCPSFRDYFMEKPNSAIDQLVAGFRDIKTE